jgi:hypothetical protein|tara:strand:+ start:16115 stop:16411 length:297 start_codon:yes stop_codon:yes gene_type:complete
MLWKSTLYRFPEHPVPGVECLSPDNLIPCSKNSPWEVVNIIIDSSSCVNMIPIHSPSRYCIVSDSVSHGLGIFTVVLFVRIVTFKKSEMDTGDMIGFP